MTHTTSLDRRLFHIVTAGRIVLFMLLLAAVWFNPFNASLQASREQLLYMLIGAAFFFTSLFAAWYRKTGPDQRLNAIQMVVDVMLVNLTILFTGGFQSKFSFLYVLAIVTACLLGGRVLGAMAALLSTIGYAAISYYTITDVDHMAPAAYNFFINMAAFNTTAVLGIWLAQRLRMTQQELTDAEAAVKRMEKIQHHLADSMRSGLIMIDESGHIIFCNRSSKTLLGPAMENCCGMKLEEVWPEIGELVLNNQDNNSVQRQEIKFSSPDIQEKILGVSSFPVHDDENNPLGYGIIFQDITEIIIKEEHLHRMDRLACLGEMAAGLAHEIRNPLASISGAAQFLAENQSLSPQSKKLLDIIFREINRLNGLTNSFMLYGRPSRESVEHVNVRSEIEEVLELMGRRKELPPASLSIELPHDAVIETEPNQLRQILVNLLLNAWQALAPQDGKIEITGEMEENRLTLCIKDNGKGISREDIERIFNPFFTTKPEGTGLGLAIVQRLVSDLGGEISVNSEPAKGTEFIITLPLASTACDTCEEEQELKEAA